MRFQQIVIAVLIGASTVVACKSDKKALQAAIIERKAMPAGKLHLTYQFLLRGQTVVDSVVIENRVHSEDSLMVWEDAEAPKGYRLSISTP